MILRIVILVFLIIGFSQDLLLAQEGATPPKKEQSIKSKRKQYREDKKKWKEERELKRAEEKKIEEHHKRIQTKEVQKRMKKSRARAMKNNSHKRDPFFQRLFQQKRGRAIKQSKERVR